MEKAPTNFYGTFRKYGEIEYKCLRSGPRVIRYQHQPRIINLTNPVFFRLPAYGGALFLGLSDDEFFDPETSLLSFPALPHVTTNLFCCNSKASCTLDDSINDFFMSNFHYPWPPRNSTKYKFTKTGLATHI